MPPALAAILFVIVILGLFWLDRDRGACTSGALWIPALWFLIACSRPVSQWLHMGTPIEDAAQALEGSPIDRLVYSSLLAAGIIVLCSRGRQVGALLRSNRVIILFFLYCALSLLWSDFPEVAFKRWMKALGDMVMLLIVLSDRNPLTAFNRLLSRTAYVLVPLSVLFIKYYPTLGVGYGPWGGKPGYIGVTTNKNTLGVISLCLGLACLWRFILAYRNQGTGSRIRRMTANGVMLSMVLWLLHTANSMTSLCTFLMGSILIVLTTSRLCVRKPLVVHLLLASMLSASASVVFLDASPQALQLMGRDPTLTDRTEVWGLLLSLVQHPLFGTGFESFWLGPRLDTIWNRYWWRPNEAHNGYLEIFLNLGWIGVLWLVIILVISYRSLFCAWRRHAPAGSIRLAYFFVGLVYNFTEAAFFRMQAPAWLFLLFAILNVPPCYLTSQNPHGEPLLQHASLPLTHEAA